MRVLHVNEYYGVAGGLERYLQAVCRELEARGHRCAVAYAVARPDDPGPAERPRYLIPGLAEGARAAWGEGAEGLRRVLRAEQPDVVLLHQIVNPGAVAAAAAWGPVARFEHGFKLVCPSGRKTWNASRCLCPRPAGFLCQAVAYRERCMPRDPRLGLRLILRTRRLAALHRSLPVIVASDFMRRMLVLNGFHPQGLRVLPYFVEAPEEPAPLPETPTVLVAGRLVPEKGVDRLLHAVAALPHPTRVLVAGDGPSRPDLARLAWELKIAGGVEFLGWLAPALARAAMNAATLVAVPSLWPEPFGIVGIEAMAHGRPVVAFDVGGVREWLQDGLTGIAVPADDVGALTSALEALLRDRALAARMGEAARRAVTCRFTAEPHVRGLLGVLEEARRPAAA